MATRYELEAGPLWPGIRGLGFGRALLFCATVLAPTLAHAADLRVELRAADGRTPVVKSASLLVSAWGRAERVPVPFTTEGARVVLTVPLEAKPDAENRYLYVEGENFVSLLSAKLDPWSTRPMTVTVRTRPQTRSVKFVDDGGRPVEGVRVTAHVAWDAPSECFSYSPVEPPPLMDGRRSDARGIVPLPDGDFPYALSIDVHEHQRIDDRSFRSSEGTLITTTTGQRVVRVHNLARRPLSLRVRIGDQPVRDFLLYAPVKFNGCGAAGAQVFGPDDLEDFYPAEVTAVCLGDEKGRVVWRSDRFDQPLVANLPAGTVLGEPDYERCTSGP